MKPCSKNRKLIAWLALGALDAPRAGELRTHLQGCDGCRRYLEEISTVTQRLTAAETPPDIQANESFHQRLVRRLRAEQPISLWQALAAPLATARLHWRVALPVLGAAALVIAMFSILSRHHAVFRPVPTAVQAISPPMLKSDLAPTIANYERVTNRSLEELDDLLTRQSRQNLSPAPIYTASMFALANAAD